MKKKIKIKKWAPYPRTAMQYVTPVLSLLLFSLMCISPVGSWEVVVVIKDFEGPNIFKCEMLKYINSTTISKASEIDRHQYKDSLFSIKIKQPVSDFDIDLRKPSISCSHINNQPFDCSMHGDNSDWGWPEKTLLDYELLYKCKGPIARKRRHTLPSARSDKCKCVKEESGVCDQSFLENVQCSEDITYPMCSMKNEPICSRCCQNYYWEFRNNMCMKCGPHSTTPKSGLYRSCSVFNFATTLAPVTPTKKPITTSTSRSSPTETTPPALLDPVSQLRVEEVADHFIIKWKYDKTKRVKFLIEVANLFNKTTSRYYLRIAIRLKPDTQYKVTVFVINHKGKEGPSTTKNFMTRPVLSFKKFGVSHSGNNVTVEWKPSFDDSTLSYVVECWKFDSHSTVNFTNTTKNVTHFTVPEGKYEVFVKAYIHGKFVLRSNIYEFDTVSYAGKSRGEILSPYSAFFSMLGVLCSLGVIQLLSFVE